ncbi:crotonobetainyl-CoA:carnitine CoA-transferase CaiB-like acyl-CoA transferase [Pararhizobium capsulatum DSM 1112]|uniref:Crotonobetainyl-CoA:carnitine CoA-transferase CaiB-like acyl-CoA transferase n=1 Tax=Pararhizobium capsulatum DSM 1112 TaxID=1121113 RepID=A0ABU0BZP7_9HYPH|nr:crotonobetainyl-CoA:carnitine CoA-transferase CaiB-like acyl-CoA transferase [Pararhizobium capsulatum DSM 1112]
MDAGNTAPMTGLKVVELARILAGPRRSPISARRSSRSKARPATITAAGAPLHRAPHGKGGTETVAAYFHAANRG